ncbi:hypothetical protein C8R44DRAFT_71977 [Mycena epipterygia]|nr:hypothetical protein C8R44DRAFT_71977 [Mycena epipterygia]
MSHDDEEMIQLQKRVNSIIRRYAPRLRCVRLSLDESIYPGIVSNGPFPILEEIHLTFSGFPPNRTFELFKDAPQLHTVYLNGFDQAVDSFFILPLQHVTEFVGDISSLDMFRLAPELVQATICDSPEFEHESDMIMVHPTLQSFTLSTWERYDPSTKVLKFLTLPALEDLDICESEDGFEPHNDKTYVILPSFLTRSSPPLRTLSMRLAPEWQNFLASLHTLEHLRLKLPRQLKPSTAAFLEQLITWLEADAESHLPALEDLTFSGWPRNLYEELVRNLPPPKTRSFQRILAR